MTTQGAQAGGRLLGIDAARGLAVIGMFVAHMLPGDAETLADGRSSVLFATLAGVSLGLATGGARRPEGSARAVVAGRIVRRSLFLIVLGLTLWLTNSGIAIILDSYCAFFLVLIPLVMAPRAGVVAVAALLALVGPPIVAAAPDPVDASTPLGILLYLPAEWFVTGYYPGAVWLVYLLAGLLVARSGLDRARTAVAAAAVGAVGALIGYGGAALLGADASAHSDTRWELAGAGGTALAVTGVALLLLDGRDAPARRVLRRLLLPLTAIGAMPLTVYTLQIVVLAVWANRPGAPAFGAQESPVLLVVLTVASAVFAIVWGRRVGRGPLERAIGAFARGPHTPPESGRAAR